MTSKQLVEEVPIAITVNEIHYSVMLASPYDLEDFVLGYLLSENVINDHLQVHDIELIILENGINVNAVLSNRQTHHFKAQQRQIKGTSGCGLCGKQAMELAFPELPVLLPRPPLAMSVIASLKSKLPTWQDKAKVSGALHAAFWIAPNGEILACREDIGRHNAVDKIIGYSLRNRLSAENASILVTSRCSVEIVQKAILCGVASLISLASPTQLSVDYASKHNVNIIHIPKRDAPLLLTQRQSS